MIEQRQKGMIKSLYKNGYGFIKQEDGSDMFFHKSGLCNVDFEDLREGLGVEYIAVEGSKGLKAIGVMVSNRIL